MDISFNKITKKMILLITYFIMILLSTADGGFSHVYGMDQCGDRCSSAAQSRECMCRTYTFAMTLISPLSFLNSTTGEVYGPAVDLVKKICETAGKLCKFSGTGLQSCWDGTFSQVLNGRWYDACVGVAKTPDRLAKYAYPENSVSSIGHAELWARAGSNITIDKLSNPHDFHLGYISIDSPLFNKALEAYFDEGYFIKDKNLIRMEGDIDTALDLLISQLSSECGSFGNSIDYVLVAPSVFPPKNFTFIAELEFDFGQATMMTRNDEQCLLKWYNEAYRELICSAEYPALCQQWSESTGDASDFCQDRSSNCS